MESKEKTRGNLPLSESVFIEFTPESLKQKARILEAFKLCFPKMKMISELQNNIIICIPGYLEKISDKKIWYKTLHLLFTEFKSAHPCFSSYQKIGKEDRILEGGVYGI